MNLEVDALFGFLEIIIEKSNLNTKHRSIDSGIGTMNASPIFITTIK
jgi:hypothetical protein